MLVRTPPQEGRRMGTEITIETPLAKALTSAGLQQYVKSFDDAGYADLMDLGGDADSVKEAVGEVVPNKPGVTNRILRLWQDAGKPVEKPINTPLAQALTSAGLQTFVKSFDDAGYTDLTELGSDEQAAKAAIATVVKDKPPIASRILALWKDTAKSVETAPIETPLAKALAGANLQAYARSFDDAGYTDLKELGSTEDGANKVIGTVVKDKPGVAQRILDLWKEATKKPGKRDALPLSQLPAGKTVDLTQDTIKIDEVTYSIPSALKVDSPDPKTFAAPDWMVIAKTTKALHGVHVDKALTSFGDEDARAPHAALVWKVPEGDDYLDTNLVSSAKSTMSYTSSLNNLVHNRIIDGSLSIATPFASVAAQASRDEKQAKSQVRKRLYMTGLWRYPMAKLTLGEFIADSDSNEGAHVREGCASLSPKFVAAVDAALAKPSEQRFNALKRVFDDFGHAVPKTVTVGGQLFFQSERDTTGNVNEDQVKNTVSVAADAKYHGVGGSVKASFQDASGAKFEGQEIAETATFAAAGGLRTLASDPAKWAGTLEADPNKWAVIERGGMIPLVEWLDKTRREAVVAAWNAGLKRAWGGFDPPVDYILPDFGGK
ncbi:MAG TPA: hypothetical protein VHJ82_04095, partial [Actinomycetota bacterium]|nr:hypothetical protein [Actinomycetota bacterium]